MRHALGTVEQRVHVDAHHGARHHAEVRQGRVAPADRREAVGDVAKALLLGQLLELGAGVGDRDEASRGLLGADRLPHALEEVLLEDVRLERRAGLARDDEDGAGEVELALARAHLRGVGGVEDAQLGMAVTARESERQQLRAEARAAHAEQEHVLEAGLLRRRARSRSSRSECASWSSATSEPAEPVRLVRPRPERRGRRPTGGFTLAPDCQSSIVSRTSVSISGGRLARWRRCACGRFAPALPAIAANSFWKAWANRSTPSAVSLSVISSSEMPSSSSAASVSRAPATSSSRLARGRPCRRKASNVAGGTVSTVSRPDQLLHVHEVGVPGVLRARARPQQPLHAGSLRRERLPALAGDACLEALVGELRVRDRDLALQLARASALLGRPVRATSSSFASAIVSIRLTKKLATDAMRGQVASARRERPPARSCTRRPPARRPGSRTAA